MKFYIRKIYEVQIRNKERKQDGKRNGGIIINVN